MLKNPEILSTLDFNISYIKNLLNIFNNENNQIQNLDYFKFDQSISYINNNSLFYRQNLIIYYYNDINSCNNIEKEINKRYRFSENFWKKNDFIEKNQIYKVYHNNTIVEKNQTSILIVLNYFNNISNLSSNIFNNIISCIEYKNNELLSFLKYHFDIFLKYDKNLLNEIFNNKVSCFLGNSILYIYEKIIPNLAIINHDGIPITLTIPKNVVNEINILQIYINSDQEIIKVVLDNDHPNAKEKCYCLGNLQHRPLTLNNINKLIENIKIYNLSNCYNIYKNVIDYCETCINQIKINLN